MIGINIELSSFYFFSLSNIKVTLFGRSTASLHPLLEMESIKCQQIVETKLEYSTKMTQVLRNNYTYCICLYTLK